MSLVCVRFVAVIAAVLATACAAVDDKAPVEEPKPPREYRTGSNIPVKEPKATTEEDRARAADQLRQMQQGGAPARP
jgi:hypothetical protein